VHWRTRGRQRWRTPFCGSLDSAKGHKGGECCCLKRKIIHKNIVESITSHRGIDNGISTMKGDGDGVMWSESGSEKKMRNPRQSYTSKERY
jgi:hypothetical protein